MKELTEVKEFIQGHFGKLNESEILPVSAAASQRKYYRYSHGGNSYIICFNDNVEENKSFVYFSHKFRGLGIYAPEVYTLSVNQKMYLQEDLGNTALIDVRNESPRESIELFKASIKQLVKLQVEADETIDYQQCFDFQEFNELLVLRDLIAAKNYFIDILQLPYSQVNLLEEFHDLGARIKNANYKGFMFRDFMSRNIMIKNNQAYFIDFQGGMKGALAYDLVSLIWQSRAKLTTEERNELYEYYLQELSKLIEVDKAKFKQDFEYCLLERLLQVMGTYGLQGLIFKKEKFTTSIQQGITNLERIQRFNFMEEFPEIKRVIEFISKNKEKVC